MGITKRAKTFDIESLLKPYRQGGTKKMPIKRTLGTLSTKLVLVDRIPADIAGSAIFDTFYEIAYEGLEFKGNGAWGSKGDQLFQYIRAKCIEVGQRYAAEKITGTILTQKACIAECPFRTLRIVKQTKWQRFKKFMIRPRGWWSL